MLSQEGFESTISEQELVEGRVLHEVSLPERGEYVEGPKGELRQLLDRILRWEATWEEGRTPERSVMGQVRPQTLSELRESERLSRVIKARYVLARIWAEHKDARKGEITPKNQDGKVYYRLNPTAVMVVGYKGESRTYRIFRDIGEEWVEESEYRGLAFPIETCPKHRIDDAALVAALAFHGKEVRGMVEWMEVEKKKIVKEEEAQVCAEYVLGLDLDKLGFISWYEDGEMSETQPVFEETEEEVAAWDGSCVDYERSTSFVQEIFEECDPECKGYMTSPKAGHGHRKVIESLRWLTGAPSRKGVVSLDFLTFEDREALILFSQASWENYKKGAKRPATPRTSDEDWASLLRT